jgi:hypothetical protein
MKFFNRYTYLPEVRADSEDRLWSQFPADQSYHASDFRRDEENNGSLTKGSKNEPDPYQFFAVNLQGFKPKCDYNQSLEARALKTHFGSDNKHWTRGILSRARMLPTKTSMEKSG